MLEDVPVMNPRLSYPMTQIVALSVAALSNVVPLKSGVPKYIVSANKFKYESHEPNSYGLNRHCLLLHLELFRQN